MNPAGPALLSLASALLLVGCGGQVTDRMDTRPAAAEQEERIMSTTQTRLSLEQAVEAARRDLAQQRQVDQDAIEVVRAEAVTWGDGSMGCPEPGMFYTQALVPGYYIQLRHGGEDAFYHGNRVHDPMHCPAERSLPPIDPGSMDEDAPR
ncbi:hypothetical protein [Wenzhouxiangella marina]|uniref:Uncharacterized protein n=1 Tax=Wenzhouxiangella marina TaxID=1579979 RepID=A0A0K0XZJ3_9GAMM|nr:hypothetical protein [Wenzhouxiangella marina]AKS43090.1 hypothetical protein WM2015_2732 [Wenzhouxiangella marina]MBB6087226.1 hypothetical protein [Wenzhouxiangella marina]